MGIESLSLQVDARRHGRHACGAAARSPRSPAMSARRASTPTASARLEQLAAASAARTRRRRRWHADLDAIEKARRSMPCRRVAIAIGLASGRFSYLNGGDMLATGAAVVGRRDRPVGARAAVPSASSTSTPSPPSARSWRPGLYCADRLRPGRPRLLGRLAVGFISSALFLVPGFPLVAALLDLRAAPDGGRHGAALPTPP